MKLIAKPGTRLERVKYYCDQRRKFFVRDALIDDDLEVRRALSDVILMTRTDATTGITQVMVKSIRGFAVGHTNGLSSSLPGLLFGKEHMRIRRLDPSKVWDFTREAWGLKKKEPETAEA
jgi:hypothetical protein